MTSNLASSSVLDLWVIERTAGHLQMIFSRSAHGYSSPSACSADYVASSSPTHTPTSAGSSSPPYAYPQRQPRIQTPPVEHQRVDPRHQLAPRHILRRKTAPAPLALHLVEDVLCIRPVPVQLRHAPHLFHRRRRHQHRILIHRIGRVYHHHSHQPLLPADLLGLPSPHPAAVPVAARQFSVSTFSPATASSMPCQPPPPEPTPSGLPCTASGPTLRLTAAVGTDRADPGFSASTIVFSVSDSTSPRNSLGQCSRGRASDMKRPVNTSNGC
jgi:hypothetical protein